MWLCQSNSRSLNYVSSFFIIFLRHNMVNCQLSTQGEGGISETIERAQVIFRHAPREPVDLLNDVQGSVITNEGKKMMFDLGVALRERYGKILSVEYNPAEIQILSSEVGRAIQSASALLLGLYKDFNLAGKWSGVEGLNYEPIPIQTLPTKSDNLMQQLGTCPRRDQFFSQRFAQWIADIFTKQGDLVSYYEKNSPLIFDGMTSNLEKFGALFSLEEDLTYLESDGKPVPSWAMPLKDQNAQIYPLHKGFQNLFRYPEIQKFQSGPLLQVLTDNFLAPEDQAIPVHLYAGHDITLVTLMSALNFSNFWVENSRKTEKEFAIVTDFGAIFMMELHQGGILKFFYGDSGNSPIKQLDLPGCGSPCHLEDFVQYIKSLSLPDYEKDCQLETVQTFENQEANGIPVFFLLLIVGGAFIIGISIARNSRKIKQRLAITTKDDYEQVA